MKTLIIDDDKTEIAIFTDLMVKTGYDVYGATSYSEGLDLFKTEYPEIVFISMIEPAQNGFKAISQDCFQAIRKIKELSEEFFVPVVAITSPGSSENILKAIECGADDFMSKPLDEIELKAKTVTMRRLTELYKNRQMQSIEINLTSVDLEKSRKALESQNSALFNVNRELEQLNNKVNRENDAASVLFGKVLGINEKLPQNVNHVIIPVDQFSGDIVLSKNRPSGGIYLLMGDFAGHGLTAAIGALPVSEIFKSMADADQPLCNFVSIINTRLKRLFPSSLFMCGAIIELDGAGNLLKVWNGGIPDILVVDMNGKIKKRIKSTHLPLGILESDRIESHPEEINVESGDHVYIFSDGVTEVFNSRNEMYGEERLERNFFNQKVESGEYSVEYDPRTVLRQIEDSIVSFSDGIKPHDDITMVQISCSLPAQFVKNPLPPTSH